MAGCSSPCQCGQRAGPCPQQSQSETLLLLTGGATHCVQAGADAAVLCGQPAECSTAAGLECGLHVAMLGVCVGENEKDGW